MPIAVGEAGEVYIVCDHLLQNVDGDMFATPVRRAASLVRAQYGPHINGRFVEGSGSSIPLRPSRQLKRYSMQEHGLAPVIERSKALTRLARLLEAKVGELAEVESLQTGRTIREMKVQLGRLPEWIDYFAALVRTQQGFVAPTQGPLLNYVTRVPLGVVAQITPFNHPLLIAVKKIAPALAAGNSVIVKPSELAPITVLEFAELAVEAGIPPSALQILPGGPETGQAIVSDPRLRKVDVTAGTAAGRAIGSTVGKNLASYTAELGGKAPIVVFGDADLEASVNGAAFACFVATGQTCVSGTRLIVEDAIYDAFVERFVEKLKSIEKRIGDPLNPKSTIGPLISASALSRTESAISTSQHTLESCTAENGSRAFPTGQFPALQRELFPPTLVGDIKPTDTLWTEEVFGPVVALVKFTGEEEGIGLANACKYGLGAGVWTKDVGRAVRVSREIEAGLVWVNAHHRNDPSSPWGGMKESGIGRENGIEAFESYSQSKSTIICTSTPEEMRTKDDWFADGDGERRYG
ncbi:aldehyde dehydrogenase family protein [Rhizoctonia solani]|uniref:Aldehyde dehydrogenase family protein n=1 Tax=Rhizoctonia solani TaxID=456999 RepID=A0A8H8NRR0_9AGAM|nr:aldehyde dehydrogenase family protein [Rhizoctonia solani]QRW18694.1 aldehyde dehydrogenase family protein [Rhizoctonia solani]